MNKKRLFTSLLTGSMAMSMCVSPVFAAMTKTTAVIDEDQAGKLTIHKIIENAGNSKEADGLVDANETRIGIDGIEFSYLKIADIVNVTGYRTWTPANGTTPAKGSDPVNAVLYDVPADIVSWFSGKNAAIAATVVYDNTGASHNYYTTEAIEASLKKILTTPNEAELLAKIKAGNHKMEKTHDGGTAVETNMPLGLYLIGETDITAHDGIAGNSSNMNNEGAYQTGGFWVETKTGAVHDDRADATFNPEGTGTDHTETVNGTTKIVRASNGEVVQEWHYYAYGQYFQETQNPEAPIVQTIASPFLVSIPTTNTTTNADTGESGTVWQYDVDVYPKNQTAQIGMRFVDPDEKAGSETLKTHEDYQIGDKIQQIMWADVPALQQNYLNWSDETDGGKNKYDSLVITANMTPTQTFDQVTDVIIVKKDTETYGGNNKTNDLYNSQVPDDIKDLDGSKNNGANLLATLTKGTDYTVSYENNQMKVTLTEAGLNKLNNATIGNQLSEPVEVTDAAEIAAGNWDYSTGSGETAKYWKKTLTDGQDAQIVVRFDSTLNNTAQIGESFQNQTYPTLQVSTTALGDEVKRLDGNEIYMYTYQLNVKKEGVADASKVKFIVGRTDANDLNQDNSKDLSNFLSSTDANGTPKASQEGVREDGVMFVKEADGVYHVYDYAQENSDVVDADAATAGNQLAVTDSRVAEVAHKDAIGDANRSTKAADSAAVNAIEVTTINGVKYYTVTPKSDGTLILKGFDSNKYTIKEMKTEDDSNLLKAAFEINLTAEDARRDGILKTATVNVAGAAEKTNLDIAEDNRGIASLSIENHDAVDLRTGGRGRMMIYASAIAMAGALGVVAIATRKKEEEE